MLPLETIAGIFSPFGVNLIPFLFLENNGQPNSSSKLLIILFACGVVQA